MNFLWVCCVCLCNIVPDGTWMAVRICWATSQELKSPQCVRKKIPRTEPEASKEDASWELGALSFLTGHPEKKKHMLSTLYLSGLWTWHPSVWRPWPKKVARNLRLTTADVLIKQPKNPFPSSRFELCPRLKFRRLGLSPRRLSGISWPWSWSSSPFCIFFVMACQTSWFSVSCKVQPAKASVTGLPISCEDFWVSSTELDLHFVMDPTQSLFS